MSEKQESRIEIAELKSQIHKLKQDKAKLVEVVKEYISCETCRRGLNSEDCKHCPKYKTYKLLQEVGENV